MNYKDVKYKIYNSITKKYIFVNIFYYNIYNKLLLDKNPDCYPYQSKFDKKKGLAKFASKNISYGLIKDYVTYKDIEYIIRNFTPIYNNYFKKNVWMNKASLDIYNDEPTKISYQTPDMVITGDIRLISVENIELSIKQGKLYNKKVGIITKKCLIERATIQDLYKMFRNDSNYKYKYIYDIDSSTDQNILLINNIADKYCSGDVDKIFVPNITVDSYDQLIHFMHPLYKSIGILGDSLFINFLKQLCTNNVITKKDVGLIIYELDNMFKKYESEEISYNAKSTKKYRISLWGLDKKKIGKKLLKRNKIIKQMLDYSEKYTDNTINQHCEQYKDELLNQLSNSKTVVIHDRSNIEKKYKCVLKRTNIEKLYDKNLPTNIISENIYDNIFNNCHKKVFSVEDHHKNPTIQGCEKLFNEVTITDQSLMSKLKYYFIYLDKKYKQLDNNYKYNFDKKIGTFPGLSIYDNISYKSLSFHLLEYYMPEWFNYIINDNFKKAFSVRQLILGNYALTWNLQRCSYVTRADPFIRFSLELNDIEWNPEINKIIISCVLSNNNIFPIRIVGDICNIDKYYYLTDDDNYVYLGNLLLKNKGGRLPYNKFFNLFIYYDKSISKLKLYNFRGNAVMPGNIYEHVKVLYVELNVIQNAYNDIGIKCYIYKYLKKDNTYFVSKYMPNQLKQQYLKIPFFENKIELIDMLLGDLECFELEKDFDKRFILKPFINIIN